MTFSRCCSLCLNSQCLCQYVPDGGGSAIAGGVGSFSSLCGATEAGGELVAQAASVSALSSDSSAQPRLVAAGLTAASVDRIGDQALKFIFALLELSVGLDLRLTDALEDAVVAVLPEGGLGLGLVGATRLQARVAQRAGQGQCHGASEDPSQPDHCGLPSALVMRGRGSQA